MASPPVPAGEGERLEELRALDILDTPPEERFDRITRLAARHFGVPMALVSLVDVNRQWFKSCQGLAVRETPREVSFCGHAILSPDTLIIEDALRDPRFRDNPLVTGDPHIRFYAGHPIRGPHGRNLGTLCILDRRPRRLDAAARQALRDLAAVTESELSATRLSGLFESLADGIVVFDAQGKIDSVNRAGCELFGWEPGGGGGEPVAKVLPGVCPAPASEGACDSPAGLGSAAGSEGVELSGRRVDGSDFPAAVTVGRMHREQGTLFVAIVHDLTARKQAEARMRLQVAALEAAANGILVTDRRGVIRWVNPAFTRLTGYPAVEVVGRNPRLLKSGRQDPAYYRALWQTVVSGSVWHGELVNRRRDGTHYTEEMTITPVRDADGQVRHFVAIKQDVTARKRAEDDLRNALDRLQTQIGAAERARGEARATLDATAEAMALVSPDGRLRAVNRRFGEFFGARASGLVGRRLSRAAKLLAISFDAPAAARERIARSITEADGEFSELLVQRRPQRRELQLGSTPVRDSSGEHLGRLYAFRDVTRERELDRLKNEFVSLVSHELRTPLTSIGGYVEMLLDGDAGELNAEQREYLQIVDHNSRRLAALIHDLLDVSRIEAGRVELKIVPVALGQLIRGVAEDLRPQLEAKAQQLEVAVAEDGPPVPCDPDRVLQVLTNLLSNAHKYTARGGHIRIGVQQIGAWVQVAVSDDGIGLSRDEQARLFTKFYRAENPSTREVGGTGLGLWITRSLVELHGGVVSVQSAPGQGARFVFTLPLEPGSGN